MKIQISVTASCSQRSGTSGKGNPYTMAEAYAHLPGCDFPQKFSYYCKDQKEVLPIGDYECDLTGKIVDGRVQFDFDPRQSRRIAALAPVANSKPSATATA